MRKILILFSICFVICLLSIQGYSAVKTTVISTGEAEWAAKVNGKLIPMKKFDKAVEYSEKQWLQKTSSKSISSIEARSIRRSILEEMVEEEIVIQWARRSRIKATDKDINQQIAAMKKKFPSNYEFHKSLAMRGMSVDDLKKNVARGLIVNKIIKIKMKESVVTDEEARRFYERNIDLYVQLPKIYLKQILVGSHERALKIIEKLKEGETFEDLAKRLSEDEDSRADGGEIGLIEKGMLTGEVEEVVFKLAPKVVSDVIETDKGYYIFMVEQRFPGKEIKFRDTKADIKRFLLMEKARSTYMKRLDEEKQNSTIIVNDKLKYLFL
ncbi:SurA N-terminal domain-containing protein [Candidatus Margulisiibacteriota bacterium]